MFSRLQGGRPALPGEWRPKDSQAASASVNNTTGAPSAPFARGTRAPTRQLHDDQRQAKIDAGRRLALRLRGGLRRTAEQVRQVRAQLVLLLGLHRGERPLDQL